MALPSSDTPSPVIHSRSEAWRASARAWVGSAVLTMSKCCDSSAVSTAVAVLSSSTIMISAACRRSVVARWGLATDSMGPW